MTRKDFELIARTLLYCQSHADSADESHLIEWVAEKFADELEHTNSRFDRVRFLSACGNGVFAE